LGDVAGGIYGFDKNSGIFALIIIQSKKGQKNIRV